MKPDDAHSETRRTAANLWFTSTLLSRLDDKRTGAIVIVAQRLHMDDLCGHVLDLSDDWEVLSLPAIAEHDVEIPTGRGGFYFRKAGEPLSTLREPLPIRRAR